MTQWMSWSMRVECPQCGRASSIRACRDRNDDGVCPTCHTRAVLTRALTAQAWAVACVLQGEWEKQERHGNPVHAMFVGSGVQFASLRIADLPAPATLAAELMGEEP